MTELKTELAKEIREETAEALEAAETLVFRARKTAHRGMLAYAGLLGMAYDRASKRFAKVTEGSDELFADLVARGEVIEAQATIVAKDARVRATKLAEQGTERVRALVPAVANDRVEDLEGEIEVLNKKIKAMNAKAVKKTTTKKTVAKKKTVKKAA